MIYFILFITLSHIFVVAYCDNCDQGHSHKSVLHNKVSYSSWYLSVSASTSADIIPNRSGIKYTRASENELIQNVFAGTNLIIF